MQSTCICIFKYKLVPRLTCTPLDAVAIGKVVAVQETQAARQVRATGARERITNTATRRNRMRSGTARHCDCAEEGDAVEIAAARDDVTRFVEEKIDQQRLSVAQEVGKVC